MNGIITIVMCGVILYGSCLMAQADEPIRPVFQTYMAEIDGWKRQIVLCRSADGRLILIGDCGPEGSALASDDEGRTWYNWTGMHTWPSRKNHPDERYRGKALLWTTPGDRIVVNQAAHREWLPASAIA